MSCVHASPSNPNRGVVTERIYAVRLELATLHMLSTSHALGRLQPFNPAAMKGRRSNTPSSLHCLFILDLPAPPHNISSLIFTIESIRWALSLLTQYCTHAMSFLHRYLFNTNLSPSNHQVLRSLILQAANPSDSLREHLDPVVHLSAKTLVSVFFADLLSCRRAYLSHILPDIKEEPEPHGSTSSVGPAAGAGVEVGHKHGGEGVAVGLVIPDALVLTDLDVIMEEIQLLEKHKDFDPSSPLAPPSPHPNPKHARAEEAEVAEKAYHLSILRANRQAFNWIDTNFIPKLLYGGRLGTVMLDPGLPFPGTPHSQLRPATQAERERRTKGRAYGVDMIAGLTRSMKPWTIEDTRKLLRLCRLVLYPLPPPNIQDQDQYRLQLQQQEPDLEPEAMSLVQTFKDAIAELPPAVLHGDLSTIDSDNFKFPPKFSAALNDVTDYFIENYLTIEIHLPPVYSYRS